MKFIYLGICEEDKLMVSKKSNEKVKKKIV